MIALLLVLAVGMQATSEAETQLQVGCFSPDGSMRTSVRSYYDCIHQNAVRLSPSGAEPEHIAIASSSACRSLQYRVEEVARVCGTAFPDLLGASYPDEVQTILRNGARETAITAVVELRAAPAS